MIAAIYARKSTDQNVADEEKSVARQIAHATAYAQRKGWTVAPEHLYQDDGISGAEFVKRPGFLRLMNALKPRPPFQVLIMSEESRLGREAIETSYALNRGRLIYGRTRWIDKGGTKIKQDVPEPEWLRVDASELRIISEDAWAAAHARLERTRHTYVIGGRLGGRPEAGIESRHLLSGFVLCGVCMGAMHAIKRTSRRGAARIYYVCNGWRVDGTCRNAWSLPLPDLDAAVVGALREDVLTPDLVDDVATRAVELWGQQHAGLDARRRAPEAELRRVERELGRFTEAIASGEAPPTLLEAMRARERRRVDLTAQLEHVDGLGRTARPTMTAALRADLRDRLESWDALLRSNPIEARPVLRRLLVGRLVCTPRQLPAGRFYEFSGTATYGELLLGVVGGLVPPAGAPLTSLRTRARLAADAKQLERTGEPDANPSARHLHRPAWFRSRPSSPPHVGAPVASASTHSAESPLARHSSPSDTSALEPYS